MKRAFLAVVTGILLTSPLLADENCEDPGCTQPACEAPCEAGCDDCQTGCKKCWSFKSWLHSHKHCPIDGQDPFANCGCNGSYKFPVPPLYTYHWPGLYSQKLMTDYHSPWRFPPIRPYTEDRAETSQTTIQRVSYAAPAPAPKRFVPVSERLRRRNGR